MRTSIQITIRDQLKAVAAKPEYGTLRAFQERALTRFLADQPYTSEEFEWYIAPPAGTPEWPAFNVILPETLQRRIRQEALRIDVSMATFLRSALMWFLSLADAGE